MNLKNKMIIGISALTAVFMVLYSAHILDLGSMFMASQQYLAIVLAVGISNEGYCEFFQHQRKTPFLA
jgi:hypothetical protein